MDDEYEKDIVELENNLSRFIGELFLYPTKTAAIQTAKDGFVETFSKINSMDTEFKRVLKM